MKTSRRPGSVGLRPVWGCRGQTFSTARADERIECTALFESHRLSLAGVSAAKENEQMATSTKRWLTNPEVCERLGVSKDTMSKWRARGAAPPFKKLPNGTLRVREDDLEDWEAALPQITRAA